MISEEDRARLMEADRAIAQLLPNTGSYSISHVTALVNSRRLHLLKRLSEITLDVGLGASKSRSNCRVGDHPLIQTIFRLRDNFDRIPEDNYTARNVAGAVLQKAVEAAIREANLISTEIQSVREHAEKQAMEKERMSKGKDMPTLASIMAQVVAKPVEAEDAAHP